MTPEDVAASADAIREEIGRVIVGQHDLVDTVIRAVVCEGHVLLEGVPGLGKTKLLATLGTVLDVSFGRVQFTPDLMPADILGTNVLLEGSFEFHQGPIFSNLVLADEVNRATPKTQSALLEAMAERRVTLGGVAHELPSPFFVMATQNPIEMEGTYPLPEAQLDRFLFKAVVPVPAIEDLIEIVDRTTTAHEPTVKPVVDAGTLREMAAATRDIPIGSHLVRYAAQLVTATHPDAEDAPDLVRTYVRHGASPRGAQALVLGGKATALLAGRPNVSAEDIWAVAPSALRHRIVLGYEATADGVDADQVIESVLAHHPAPTVAP